MPISSIGSQLVGTSTSNVDISRLTEKVDTTVVETHLFVLAGQSNMVGRAYKDLPPVGLGVDYVDGILQVARTDRTSGGVDGELVQAISPIDHWDENANDIGISISFANEYQKRFPNVTLVLMGCAKGATSFYSNNWNVGDSYYEEMMRRIDTVMTANPDIKLKGLLWHQGEHDTYNETASVEHKGKFKSMLDNFFSRVGNVPTVIGTSVPQWIDDDTDGMSGNRIKVENGILEVGNEYNNVITVSAREPFELLHTGVDIHFQSDTIRILGDRYLKAYFALLYNEKPLYNIYAKKRHHTIELFPDLKENTSTAWKKGLTSLSVSSSNYYPTVTVAGEYKGYASASILLDAKYDSRRGAGIHMFNRMTEYDGTDGIPVNAGRSWFFGTRYSSASGIFGVFFRDDHTFSASSNQSTYQLWAIDAIESVVDTKLYSKLGEYAPSVKTKKILGTTGTTEGDIVNTPHDIVPSKIISWTLKVENDTDSGITEGSSASGMEVHSSHDSVNFMIENVSGNSSNVLGKPFTLFITYEK